MLNRLFAPVLIAGLLLADMSAQAKDSGLVHGQPLPTHVIASRLSDFNVPPNVAVFHYYGSGGWGIQWGHTYLLAAPYFSNHNLAALVASHVSGLIPLKPDEKAVRDGFAGTPVGSTTAILIGHGHIDHAGDVPAFFGPGLIENKPILIADRSTTNELAALSPRFGCIAPIDYWNPETAPSHCPISNVRITAIHHAHAPHVDVAGLEVSAFGGIVKEPRTDLPTHADDFKLGNTWAFLIDLLDERGNIALRIHYADAASGPPHGIIPEALLAQHDVDIHIACVPGFEQSDDYPDAILEHLRVKYVLGGHWEDFFQPRDSPLRPVRDVLDGDAMDRFVTRVVQKIPHARGVAPLNKDAAHCGPNQCGPHGETWAIPIPGETYQFATSTSAASGAVASKPDAP